MFSSIYCHVTNLALGFAATGAATDVAAAAGTVVADDKSSLMDSINGYCDQAVAKAPEYAVNLLTAILIFVVGKWLSRKIAKLVAKLVTKTQDDTMLANYIENIIYYVLFIVTLITAAGKLGIPTTSLVTILGAAGLAIGLALKDSLSNFASGFMLISFKPFKVGQVIEAAGVVGTVESISTFNTVINTPDNQKIIVPNSAVTASIITNRNANPTRRVDLVIGIGYEDDIEKAKKVLFGLMAADDRILKNPEATVLVLELGDSSVNLGVRPWVNSADYGGVKFGLLEQIKNTFDQEKISFPYPQQDVHMYQR